MRLYIFKDYLVFKESFTCRTFMRFAVLLSGADVRLTQARASANYFHYITIVTNNIATYIICLLRL